MKLALSNSILKFWRLFVFICIALLLGISSVSDCSAMLLFFVVLIIGALVLSFAVWRTKKNAMALIVLMDRFTGTAALLFLVAILVAGAIGVSQGESFIRSACGGAVTAARFATTMLKFVAHAL